MLTLDSFFFFIQNLIIFNIYLHLSIILYGFPSDHLDYNELGVGWKGENSEKIARDKEYMGYLEMSLISEGLECWFWIYLKEERYRCKDKWQIIWNESTGHLNRIIYLSLSQVIDFVRALSGHQNLLLPRREIQAMEYH